MNDFTDRYLIEIPYAPDVSCVVDFSGFGSYADLQAYECVRLYSKDLWEFDSLDDIGVLDPLINKIFDHEGELITFTMLPIY